MKSWIRTSRSATVYELAEEGLGKVLGWLAPKVLGEPRVIMDRAGKAPYLSRYYLLRKPKAVTFNVEGNPEPGAEYPKGMSVFLHYFHASDEDGALHSHPWAWSGSFILSGGYTEERTWLSKGEEEMRLGATDNEEFSSFPHLRNTVRRPFTFNVLGEHDYHRAVLRHPERGCWTLFVAGPQVASDMWHFLEKGTGLVYTWRDYITKRRQTADWKVS